MLIIRSNRHRKWMEVQQKKTIIRTGIWTTTTTTRKKYARKRKKYSIKRSLIYWKRVHTYVRQRSWHANTSKTTSFLLIRLLLLRQNNIIYIFLIFFFVSFHTQIDKIYVKDVIMMIKLSASTKNKNRIHTWRIIFVFGFIKAWMRKTHCLCLCTT